VVTIFFPHLWLYKELLCEVSRSHYALAFDPILPPLRWAVGCFSFTNLLKWYQQCMQNECCHTHYHSCIDPLQTLSFLKLPEEACSRRGKNTPQHTSEIQIHSVWIIWDPNSQLILSTAYNICAAYSFRQNTKAVIAWKGISQSSALAHASISILNWVMCLNKQWSCSWCSFQDTTVVCLACLKLQLSCFYSSILLNTYKKVS